MKAACLAGLGRVSHYSFSSPNIGRNAFIPDQRKPTKLNKIFQKFHIGQLKQKCYAFLNCCLCVDHCGSCKLWITVSCGSSALQSDKSNED